MSQNQISRELAKTAPPDDSPAPPNVPDLIRIGAIPTNLQMDIDTDILEPVVKSDSFIRYVLDKKGFLHSNSKLIFSMSAGDQASTAFFPLGIGVMSLIERATLKVGNKTINEIDDWNHYQAYRSMFVSNENNKERELVTTGRAMCFDFAYDNTSGTLAVADTAPPLAGTGESNYSAEKYQLDVNRQMNAQAVREGAAATNNTLLPPYVTTTNVEGSPEFQINLSDLFPFLKQNQLPLYMVDEQISIELRMSPMSKNQRLCYSGGDTAFTNPAIDLTKCKMVADYVFYPTEIMAAYQQQNQDLTFTYMDYHLSKQGFTPDGTNETIIIRDVGGAGKICTKLIVSCAMTAANPEQALQNQYTSQYPLEKSATINGSVVSNVRYNGEFLYPIDHTNPALQFHDMSQAEGSLPFVTRALYSGEGDDVTADTFMGRAMNTNLRRQSFRQAYRLNRNERINSRGIELYNTFKVLQNAVHTQRCWVESVKVAHLRGGMLDCYDA